MTIVCDSREQQWEHVKGFFDRGSVPWIRSKLWVGDYARLDDMSVCIDRKDSLQEVSQNVIQQHDRFRDECMRARDHGIRLVVLVEHGIHVQGMKDVRAWDNPRLRLSPKAATGPRLAAIMEAMAEKYDVGWAFCTKQQTGGKILELLHRGDTQPVCCGRSSFEVRSIDNLPFLCCTCCGHPHHIVTAKEITKGI